MIEAEEYLEKHIKHIIEPLVDSLIIEQPKEPVDYMINWLSLNKNLNIPIIPFPVVNEKEEIQNNALPHSSSTTSNPPNPTANPPNPTTPNLSLPQNNVNNGNHPHLPIHKKRIGISAESYGIFNKKEVFVPKIIEKSEEQKKNIFKRVMQSFMFNQLDDNELMTVINAMSEKTVEEGEYIIRQGDPGGELYLIDSGTADCYKVFNPEDGDKYLKTYYPGEAFGELALLYNAVRAASIISKTKCILWVLDRETFNSIVKDSASKRRERYNNFLKTIEIFKDMDPYEIGLVCEAIKSKKAKTNEYIINQGEQGNEFYILEEGIADVELKKGDSPSEVVLKYEKGNYFGELALITDGPRAASVLAKSDCCLLYLERSAFKRLLGPLENILKRNSEIYVKYMNKLGTSKANQDK